MTTLAVLSDLHANLGAWEAVEADLARRGVDQVVVLGDVVGYLARPNQVARKLAQAVARPGWRALAGNYDLAVLAGGEEGVSRFLKPGIGPVPRQVFDWTCQRVSPSTREFLASLPQSLSFDLAGVPCLAVHGSPDGVRDYVFPDRPREDLAAWLAREGVRCLFLGHTHLPFVRRVPGGLVVNPGSVGKPKDGDPRASYALVHFGPEPRAEIVRLDYDLAAEAALLQEAGLPPQTVEKLKSGT